MIRRAAKNSAANTRVIVCDGAIVQPAAIRATAITMGHVPGNDAIVESAAACAAAVVSHIASENAIGDDRIGGFTKHAAALLKPVPVAGAVSQSESVQRRTV